MYPEATITDIFRVIIKGGCGSPVGVYSNYVILRVNVPPIITKQPVAEMSATSAVLFTSSHTEQGW